MLVSLVPLTNKQDPERQATLGMHYQSVREREARLGSWSIIKNQQIPWARKSTLCPEGKNWAKDMEEGWNSSVRVLDPLRACNFAAGNDNPAMADTGFCQNPNDDTSQGECSVPGRGRSSRCTGCEMRFTGRERYFQ